MVFFLCLCYNRTYLQHKKGLNILKLTQDGEVLAENKVLILYILNKLEDPITNDSLLRIVLSVIDMNYFYFQQFLLDLIEKKYIVCFEKDGKSVYKITESGKTTLDLTNNIIPGIIKLKVDTSFEDSLKQSNDEESITAEYVPLNENDYTVTCKIIEKNRVIFEVSVFAGSRDEAKKIVDNWKENAYSIYPEILNSLNKSC